MSRLSKLSISTTFLYLLMYNNVTSANTVQIISADLHNNSSNIWSISVTLKHEDKGWEHFADTWRVVSAKGDMLGKRVLHHPHENEQPFTRSLAGIHVPKAMKVIYIEAHDKVHGWSEKRLKIDLNKAVNGRLTVNAK